jgi:hypothetical protein
MDDHQTQDLVKELVRRLLSSGAGGGRDEDGALRFANRLLSSRLAPAVLPDEHSLAESIKRRLAASGRPDDALAFADLHSKLSVRARPASLWLLLYLLDSLSSHRRAAAAASCLPNLPTAAPPRTTAAAPGARGRPGSRVSQVLLNSCTDYLTRVTRKCMRMYRLFNMCNKKMHLCVTHVHKFQGESVNHRQLFKFPVPIKQTVVSESENALPDLNCHYQYPQNPVKIQELNTID